ncbi:MAG: anthranilate synthase component I [Chloroherpetonaceae bacterium]|nr:anthranilate synthase component I [Chloroherpetonaceae bacterium]MDW8438768.1 anthranilate synthase component I [Chloroherpetonaceae bacterium]
MRNPTSNAKPASPSFVFHLVQEEFIADTETPVSLYLKLRSKHSCLLESVEGEERLARFSYIGLEPFALFEASIDEKQGERFKLKILDNKFSRLKRLVKSAPTAKQALERALAAFSNADPPRAMTTSGAFGFIGYDAVRFIEKIPFPKQPDPANLPDIFLMFFDTLVVFDNVKRKLFIVSNYLSAKDKPNAEKKIRRIRKKLLSPLKPSQIRLSRERRDKTKSNLSKDAFVEKALRAKEYILAGDIFQVQLSQRLRRALSAKPFDVYRALRTINPSPHLYFFELGEAQIIGSSPELLVGVTKQGERFVVETRPIAGTRPRGATPEEDAALMRDLLSNEKERAEHLMLIDLARNDVGRVAEIGTVETTEMMVIEKYSHVMHLVSHVRGMLQEGLSPMEAFWSCFPAGTLTGAPKIRAMQIIAELEAEKRGLYGGAVGFFDFNGNIKTAIAIRTMVVKDHTIYFQAAGGIVADSTPDGEYQETLSKMAAGLRAVASLINPKLKAPQAV